MWDSFVVIQGSIVWQVFNKLLLQVLNEVYGNPANRLCADCGGARPHWAVLHLCSVVCSFCAGIHRQYWPFRVKSLRMDIKIWTLPLINVRLQLVPVCLCCVGRYHWYLKVFATNPFNLKCPGITNCIPRDWLISYKVGFIMWHEAISKNFVTAIVVAFCIVSAIFTTRQSDNQWSVGVVFV